MGPCTHTKPRRPVGGGDQVTSAAPLGHSHISILSTKFDFGKVLFQYKLLSLIFQLLDVDYILQYNMIRAILCSLSSTVCPHGHYIICHEPHYWFIVGTMKE